MSEVPDDLLRIVANPDLFQAALDALPVAAIIAEGEPDSTRVLAINDRFVHLLGWTRDDLIGQHVLETGLYVGPIVMGDLMFSLDATGELLHYESEARMKDGGLRRMKNSTSIFELGGRKYSISTSVGVDVDDVELDDALHESEARLQSILDAIPFIFAVVEPDGRFRMANRTLCEQTGHDLDQVLGHHLEDVFSHSSAQAMRSYLGRMASGAELEVTEGSFAVGEEPHWFRTSCFPLRRRRGDDAGQAYAACVLAIDVTDERMTEAALRESDTRFRQLASSIDDAFILWGGDPPQVLYQSPRLARLYGLDDLSETPSNQEVRDRTTHPDDEELRKRMFERRLHSDEDLDYEYRIIRPDGDIRWIRVRSSRVRVDGQPVDRIATTISDITDRKQAELELHAAWATAEEANQRKNDFLSRMSHELRTPLNAILGFTQLLELEDLTGDQLSSLGHVAHAGRHLLELINDVLDVSRIESGELRLARGPIDLADAVLETVAMMRPLTEQSDVVLDLALDAPSVTVDADRHRLIQVLLNLLTNAVKFNHPGGRASLRWKALDNGRVRIDVRDSGIGIAADDLERLFTPFERFAPEIQGTGIGLVLTRQLVEAMGGTITVASTVGEGTTVSVEMPGAEVHRASASDPMVSASTAWPRERVLYVNPNRADVDLLRRTLDLVSGCELEVARSGRDALRRALDHPPDLLLLDVMLTDESAVDVVRRLQAQPQTAGTEIIALSADDSLAQRAALEQVGVTRFLTKPFRLSQLLVAVEDAIQR